MGGWQERESAGAAEGKGKQADGLWGQGRNYGEGKIGGTKRGETEEFEGRRNSAGFASIRRGLFWKTLSDSFRVENQRFLIFIFLLFKCFLNLRYSATKSKKKNRHQVVADRIKR